MGRSVKEAPITTRTSRARLKVAKAPYWRALDHGVHLGYRKNKNGGVWIARHRREDGTYATSVIGKADDNDKLPADGRTILDYSQAQRRSANWCRDEAGDNNDAVYTVADALADYRAWYKPNRKAFTEVQRRSRRDIEPALGRILVAKLTARQIRQWHEGLATSPRGVRAPRFGEPKPQPPPRTADERRRRRHTANKGLTILKAALNYAYREGRGGITTDSEWRRVKPFKGVDQPVVRYLTNVECVRLVNACDSKFRLLVSGALYTACRYGELVRMQYRDFNADAGKVTVREGKGGKPRHVTLSREGVEFFRRQCAGREPGALMFARGDGSKWGTSQQIRRLGAACERAQISPAITFHILRHTHASQLAMRGVPLAVIAAQLGHADTRISQRHYAHLAPDYVSETIRANLPELGLGEADNVVTIG